MLSPNYNLKSDYNFNAIWVKVQDQHMINLDLMIHEHLPTSTFQQQDSQSVWACASPNYLLLHTYSGHHNKLTEKHWSSVKSSLCGNLEINHKSSVGYLWFSCGTVVQHSHCQRVWMRKFYGKVSADSNTERATQNDMHTQTPPHTLNFRPSLT